MKNFAFLAVVASAFLAAVAVKPVSGEEGTEQRELFKKLDGNQDGKITADEVGSKQAKYFNRLVRIGDKDGDRVLTKEEFLKALEKKKRPVVDARVPSNGPNRRQQAEKFFQRLDSNGDGQISIDEVPERGKERFARLLRRAGKSENGSIGKKQFLQLHARRGQGKDSAQTGGGKKKKKTARGGRTAGDLMGPPRFFRMLDANKDGRLDKTELAKVADKFDALDTNKDGSLEPRELFGPPSRSFAGNRKGKGKRQRRPTGKKAARRAGKFVQNLIKRFDKDGDAKISKDEAPPKLAKRFAKIDTNADGVVDAKELKQGFQKRRRGKQKKRNRKRPATNAS